MPKSELHCHLDGCVRVITLHNHAKRKNICTKEIFTLQDTLTKSTVDFSVVSLSDYLTRFFYVNEICGNDIPVLKQIAEEFCIDKFNDNVRYIEVRYAPQLFAGDNISTREVVELFVKVFDEQTKILNEKYDKDYQEEIARLKNKGVPDDQLPPKLPKFIVKQILCGIWHFPEWLDESIDIITKIDPIYEHVVGVDVAGDMKEWKDTEESKIIERQFERAKKLGIYRTMHAGEATNCESVMWAIEKLNVNRVGHGYHLKEFLDDPKYEKTGQKHLFYDVMNKNYRHQDRKVHFEYCPLSSFYTRSQTKENHTIQVLDPVRDNFSISTDSQCWKNRATHWLEEPVSDRISFL